MKKYLASILSTALMLAVLPIATSHAQTSPEPTPSVTALTPVVVQPAPASFVAQSAAKSAVMQANMLASNLTTLLCHGFPARGGNPAASAYEVQQALGGANLAKLNAAIVALGGVAVPTATPPAQ